MSRQAQPKERPAVSAEHSNDFMPDSEGQRRQNDNDIPECGSSLPSDSVADQQNAQAHNLHLHNSDNQSEHPTRPDLKIHSITAIVEDMILHKVSHLAS
jgi:hypothetical protein